MEDRNTTSNTEMTCVSTRAQEVSEKASNLRARLSLILSWVESLGWVNRLTRSSRDDCASLRTRVMRDSKSRAAISCWREIWASGWLKMGATDTSARSRSRLVS